MTVPTSTAPSTRDTTVAVGDLGAVDRVPHQLFIAGQRTPATDGGTLEVRNPATEAVIAHVADATIEDARRALVAAAEAQARWALTPAGTRAEVLHRTYQLMLERTDLLAEVMTLERPYVVTAWYRAWSCHLPAMLTNDGATPNRTNPLRSSTRCDRTLCNRVPAWIRCSRSSSKATRMMSRTAAVARPWPLSVALTQ
jgi:hypothetical protein